MDNPLAFKGLLDEQCGLLSQAQLRAAGLTSAQIRRRTGRNWQLVHAGVVATFTGRLDTRQRLIAAQLFAGPDGYLGSNTAATWHGVESARDHMIRVSVPASRRARRRGVVLLERTSRPDHAVWQRGPLRIASRPRAVIDAARAADGERQAMAIVIESVQRRIVLAESLRAELESGPRRGSAQARRAVEVAELGAWSVPECDLLEVLAASRLLPRPWANPLLTTPDGRRLPTPDAWFDEVGLAVQVHSRTYHLRDEDWDATVRGDGLLGEHGIVVLGVTPAALNSDAARIRTQVERGYLSLTGRPRPNVIATPQPGTGGLRPPANR